MKEVFYGFIAIIVSMLGYAIHNSIFWSIVDFVFWPIAVIKWLICHELTMGVIKNTFGWFF